VTPAKDPSQDAHALETARTATSVLWPIGVAEPAGLHQPACFEDLNLDQILEDLLAGFEIYELLPVFWTPLPNVAAVQYRQAVMADVERPEIQAAVRAFSQVMGRVRWALARAETLYDHRQRQRWFLDAAEHYAAGVSALLQALLGAPVASSGLRQFRDYLTAYASSQGFIAMKAEVDRLSHALAAIRYKIHVRGLRVDLEADQGEEDYSKAVLRTFDRFRQGETRAFPFEASEHADMDSVEAAILEQLSKMHPELFASVAGFQSRYADFQDRCIVRFDREIHVYLAYFDYIAPLRSAGLSFCVPELVGSEEPLEAVGIFDVALARKMRSDKAAPVPNDFHLRDPERILVVSGPNQGGKTTFARTFGQVHWLANLGLPVPGDRARLRQFDHLFTHFERGENTADLRGKLADDLVRVHEMLGASSARTVIIFNEMFTSTTFRDALVLSKAIMRKLVEGGLTAVWVTFIDELASWNEHVVSMVSNVDPEDPTRRTFTIERRPADGLAYAVSIAHKWGVTLPQIRERLGR
jgi:hypothetical protein